MAHGRHAAPTTPIFTRNRVLATGTLAATAATGGAMTTATHAEAAPSHDWSGVARCESSGNWAINTGNGFYGGLQFAASTWIGFGGGAFAPRANLATPDQQVTIAERVLAGQGIGAWPVCGRLLTAGSTPAAPPSTVVVKPLPGRHAGPPPLPPVIRPSDPVYTVMSGDCLSVIAANHGTTTAALYNANRDVVGGNEDLIFPGQKLRLPGAVTVPPPRDPAPAVSTAAASSPAPVTGIPRHAAPVTDPLPGHRVGSHTTTPGIQEVDLDAPMRSPIYSATAGTVMFAQGSGVRGFGGWIVIRSILDGVSYDFVYGHEFTSGILVQPGETVQAGEQIGNVGQNGNATGPHVCFWIWQGPVSHGTVLDPVPFMAAHGVPL